MPVSTKAEGMLANWEECQHRFKWVMPRALLQYQDAEAILAAL